MLLLHTLNHSLFKSLLFYSAGNVYQAAHTLNIERLGGLIKRMPKTAILFLVAAIAICGLPPLNGFISEFMIYAGIYNWLFSASLISLIAIIFALVGLVLIGGLAILCFTKAFSVVFLGKSRDIPEGNIKETGFWQLLPMYMTVTLMIIIGLFPSVFISALQTPVNLFTHHIVFNLNLIKVSAIDSLQIISWLFMVFILVVAGLMILKKLVQRNRLIVKGPTWGCGYNAAGSKVQYTAGSFVKSYSKLAKPFLKIEKSGDDVDKVFPSLKHYYTRVL